MVIVEKKASRNRAWRGDRLTNEIMPEFYGRELARRIKEICSSVHGLYLSGNTTDTIFHQGVLVEKVYYTEHPVPRVILAGKYEWRRRHKAIAFEDGECLSGVYAFRGHTLQQRSWRTPTELWKMN